MKRMMKILTVAAIALPFVWVGHRRSVGAEKWIWDSKRGWVQPESTKENTAEGRYDHAVALMVEEEFSGAAREFETFAKDFPKHELVVPARMRWAECMYRMGEPWRAFELAERCLPQADDAQRKELIALEYAAGMAALEVNDEHTVRILEWVIKHDPSGEHADDAQFNLGVYYQKLGQYDDANRAYDAVRDRFPKSPLVPQALFNSALCCLVLSRKDWHQTELLKDARQRFEAYLAASPGGAAERERSRVAKQYLDMIKAIETAASRPVVDFYYGMLLYSEGRYPDAVPCFKNAAKEMRGSNTGEEAQYHLAECLYRLGDIDGAFKQFNTLFKEYPTTRFTLEAGEKLYRIGEATMKKDPGKAAGRFAKVIEYVPHAIYADDAQFKMAECYFNLKQYEKAQTAYEMLLETYKESEWAGAAMVQLGRCYLARAKRLNAGESLATKACGKFEDYLLKYPYGVKVKDARFYLREAQDFLAEQEYKVGEFYVRQKLPMAALIYFRRIVKEFPGSKWSTKAQEKIKSLEGRG